MPRVKIDYVVSFSSEDPDNPASNLLGWEVSKKRWLCMKGEPSCSVVLQLSRAVKISAVHVGAYQAALVEVLVGRSEKPHEEFKVLVPSCIFLSPSESRKEEQPERVRSFASHQLSEVGGQRWDRVRVVASQPYNKHCKYGLNFIHIYEPEDKEPTTQPASLPPRLLIPDATSSDDEFSPGELFANHRKHLNSSHTTDTGAQIRQATSQALKNVSDSSTKLVKTPISKESSKRQSHAEPSTSNRHRNDLIYTDDDDKPHAKIDHIVARHKDEKSKEDKKLKDKHDRKKDANQSFRKEESEKRNGIGDSQKDREVKTPKGGKKILSPPAKEEINVPTTSGNRHSDTVKKRSHENKKRKKAVDPGSILKGVVFVLSGYVNPERASIRDQALSMGARCERDWNDRCTHLICAFPNTPKLKQVRGTGAEVPIVTAAWVPACRREGNRVPWRGFATDPAAREPHGQGDSHSGPGEHSADEECDTDDEIERAMHQQKKQRTSSSPNRSSKVNMNISDVTNINDITNISDVTNTSAVSDVVFVRDERVQGDVVLDDSDDTDHWEQDIGEESIDESRSLPALFAGRTFVVDDGCPRADLLRRYVAAYGGLLLRRSELDDESSVDYVVCTRAEAGSGGATSVRPEWVWRCHHTKELCPEKPYLVKKDTSCY